MCENRFGNLNFVILDRYNICQVAVEHQALNLDRCHLLSYLWSFNEQHFFTCFLDRLHGFNTKLEILFLEVLNHPRSTKIQESAFCQRIS